MKILSNWLKERSTLFLFFVPIFIATVISYIATYIGKISYPDGLPSLYLQITGTILSFLFGSAGIILIIRKELPSMTWISLNGDPAMVFGFLWIIFWWGLAIAGLVRIIHIIS